MSFRELQALNESILIMAHDLAVRDVEEAAIVLGVSKDVAYAISEVSVSRLRVVAQGARILLQPATLHPDLWNNLQGVDDDAAAALPILTNNPHRE